MLNPANLPDDMDALKAMLSASLAVIADRDAVIERKEDRIIRLEKLLADFKRALFGHRSEKSDPEQFELALEDIETAIAAIHAEDEAVDPPKSSPAKPRNANRGSLPKHLPRIEEVIEPDTQICVCGGGLHCIGEDVSERLDPRREKGPPDLFLALLDPGPVPRDRHPPSEVCLPILLKRCCASSGPGAADRGRHANGGDGERQIDRRLLSLAINELGVCREYHFMHLV